MARDRKKGSKNPGPYLTAAILCEKILMEPDGVHTAVRIVDTLNLPSDLPLEKGECRTGSERVRIVREAYSASYRILPGSL